MSDFVVVGTDTYSEFHNRIERYYDVPAENVNIGESCFAALNERSAGGTRSFENLRLACQPCNNQKGSMHPADFERMVWLTA